MKALLVSILIPCHNAGRFVGAALDSVLAQTWQDKEVIVVNDGSTDDSAAVLEKYTSQGIQVITPTKPLHSASRARNLAYNHSTGDYIKFFDADDLLHPEMVQQQMERLGNSTTNVASSGWGRFYGDDLSTFQSAPQPVWRDMDARDWLAEAFCDARPMMQPGMFLLPRSLIDIVGLWDEKLSLIDDFEFFSRVLSHADGVRFTPGVPLYYRSGIDRSLSKQMSRLAVESAFQSLLQGTSHLLRKRDDKVSRSACANVLQDFIFTYYPEHQDLLTIMRARITQLGGSRLEPDGPPRFKKLKKIFGWKFARRIQRLAGR